MDHTSHKYAEPIKSITLDSADKPPREHWLETVAGRTLGILALIAAFATVGGFDYADQIAAQAKAKQERAARIAAYVDFHKDAIRLSHPCGATIATGGTSVTMEPARCVRVVETKR